MDVVFWSVFYWRKEIKRNPLKEKCSVVNLWLCFVDCKLDILHIYLGARFQPLLKQQVAFDFKFWFLIDFLIFMFLVFFMSLLFHWHFLFLQVNDTSVTTLCISSLFFIILYSSELKIHS